MQGGYVMPGQLRVPGAVVMWNFQKGTHQGPLSLSKPMLATMVRSNVAMCIDEFLV